MTATDTTPAQSSGDSLLTIRGLRIDTSSADGGRTEIVKGVDLDLPRGRVVGLVGESGAGKTMLGLAAMGYIRSGCRIAGGQVLFRGEDLVAASEKAKRKLRGEAIAYMAQSAIASFNPAHRLIKQFAETPLQHGVKNKEQAYADAIDWYGRLSLPGPETVGFLYPHQVSGGQLQRSMLAMAMACRPDLIIFDEPTTALDVTTQIEVLAAIRAVIKQFHTAAIYISHDLAVVAQVADRIVVMRHGEIVEEADTRTMLAAPRESYTKSLWALRSSTKIETPRNDEQPLLSVLHANARYSSGDQVLHDLSLHVYKGRTLAVVGQSGSGKSTLARVIVGLLPPESGEILFNQAALPPTLGQRSLDQRRRIQMIYQTPDTAFNPRQTVKQILGRPVQLYFGKRGKELDRRVAELLEMIELPPSFADRYPSELSGGQKQRIGIARALAAEPDLVICDEVTSELDRIVAQNILKLLLDRQRDFGFSYLFITHDLGTVAAIADEVMVMLQGRVVEQGPKSKIMSAPREDYTKLLLASVPRMDADWLDGVLAQRDRLTSAEVIEPV